MKLSKLTGLKDLDVPFDDPFEIYYGGDKKKKKKKKDKEKDSFEDGSFKESLKEMGRKELEKMADKMGVDLDFVDRQDKKAMRKAILKAHKDASQKKSLAISKEDKKKSIGLQMAENDDVPFYFDPDSRDFVIKKADDAKDMDCYNAMRSLGHIRRKKRDDDGFGVLMQKLDDLIQRGALDEGKEEDVIEVSDYKVKDVTPNAIELTADEVKTISDDIDEAIAERAKRK